MKALAPILNDPLSFLKGVHISCGRPSPEWFFFGLFYEPRQKLHAPHGWVIYKLVPIHCNSHQLIVIAAIQVCTVFRHHHYNNRGLSKDSILILDRQWRQEMKPDSSKWQEKRQWAQIEIQDIPCRHKKKKNPLVFTVRVIKHWNRLPRKVMESQSLETHETQLDTVLGNLLSLTLLWAGRLDQKISRGLFQAQTFYDIRPCKPHC